MVTGILILGAITAWFIISIAVGILAGRWIAYCEQNGRPQSAPEKETMNDYS